LLICTWKQPSASVNPAIQLGSKVSGNITEGLETDIILENSVFNAGDKPLFIVDFIARNLASHSAVFSFLLSNSIPNFQSSKSALF